MGRQVDDRRLAGPRRRAVSVAASPVTAWPPNSPATVLASWSAKVSVGNPSAWARANASSSVGPLFPLPCTYCSTLADGSENSAKSSARKRVPSVSAAKGR